MRSIDRSKRRPDGGTDSAPWRVGAADRIITPERSMRMAGYGMRDERSVGVDMDIHAKAVAFEDRDGNCAVVVGAELLGITRSLREAVETTCEDEYGIVPDELLLNTSHTHQGPEYRQDEWGTWDFTEEDDRRAREYRQRLEGELVDVVGEALDDRSPAELRYVPGTCGIAMNRRLPREDGFRFHQNPRGSVDHDVPVLVATAGDVVSAVLFGYACHPTSLPISRRYHGDWAGHAMANIEAEFPQATALFVQGCGGDIKAYPQDGPDRTVQHGRSLSNAVRAAIDAGGTEIRGSLRTCLEEITLSYRQPPSREELERMDDQEFARRLLDELDRDGDVRTEFPYPIQAIGFDDGPTMLGLAGEPLVDYSLRLKDELEGDVWVAGYSNEGYFYVPSARNVHEGGYESGWVDVYADRPAPPEPDNEDRIVGAAVALAERVGGRRRSD